MNGHVIKRGPDANGPKGPSDPLSAERNKEKEKEKRREEKRKKGNPVARLRLLLVWR